MVIISKPQQILLRNLLCMWRESSSGKGVNLVKKSVAVTEIMNFS